VVVDGIDWTNAAGVDGGVMVDDDPQFFHC
jgi:hypothetical protein